MPSNILTTTDASFENDVVRSSAPVLVDFWADWCGPCKMLNPILGDIADEYADRLRIAKINADENESSVSRLSVRGLPSLVLMVDGIERGRLVGVVTKTRLAAFIDDGLAS